jgi:hypothetical protein
MDNTPTIHRKKTNIQKQNIYLLLYFPLKTNKNLKCKNYSLPKGIANWVNHIFFPMEKRSRCHNLLPKEKESSIALIFSSLKRKQSKGCLMIYSYILH